MWSRPYGGLFGGPVPYTNKTPRYEQSYDDDAGGPVALWQLVAAVGMVPVVWYLDLAYNRGSLFEGVSAILGF